MSLAIIGAPLAAPAVESVRGGGGLRFGRAFQPRDRGPQARLRVDQELTGHDHPIPRLEARADLGAVAGLHADLDVDRAELAVARGDDDDTALAGSDHRSEEHTSELQSR